MKYVIAKKLSQTGKFHETFRRAFQALPDKVVKTCTSRQIANIIDYGQKQKELGYAEGYREATA
jgi:hypothetical protein